MKTAGIKSTTRLNNTLVLDIKQALLLFDLIGVPLLNKYIDFLKKPINKSEENSYLVNEFEYLKDSGYLFDAWEQTSNQISDKVDFKTFAQEHDILSKSIQQTFDLQLSEDSAARLCALSLNSMHDPPDFISIPIIKSLTLPNQNNIKKEDVIRVIIEKMPIPSEATPWESIKDFKADNRNSGKLASLKVWLNSVVKSERSISEVEDELEHLLHDYEQSLKIHNIKFRTGVFQSLTVGTAEVIENMVWLKFSKLASGLFSARKEKAELLSLELNAPGREVAYIVEANTRFK